MNKLLPVKNIIQENGLENSLYTLARFIDESIPNASSLDLWLMVLVNIEISAGNVCVDFEAIHQKSKSHGWVIKESKADLLKLIQNSPVIGSSEDQSPLIFDLNRLYMNRYFHNEQRIAQTLWDMKSDVLELQKQQIDLINRQFPDNNSTQVDYQKLAALVSIRNRLSIISGGPGTGKTWTVSHIIGLLSKQNKNLKIALAAPTGKAAARLTQSIQNTQQQLYQDQQLTEAVTLHRLLGIHRFTHRPRYHAANPLECDVLVVDEASMIDQQMMAMLCAALPDHCRLILLGDKDQLSSVEAGSVFADLCGGLSETQFSQTQKDLCQQYWGYDLKLATQQFAFNDHLVMLTKSHRFDDQSGIGQLARLVNAGDIDASLQVLKQAQNDQLLNWMELADGDIKTRLKLEPVSMACALSQAENINQAFKIFYQYQLLCAVWGGPTGVDSINQEIETGVKNKLSIAPDTELYQGIPLMMTSNAYQYGIYNGDIGIIWPDEEKQMKVWFEQGGGEYKILSLSQCPHYKTAYAMTVHKSQGSEFNKILLVLPDSEVAVATRELFYTGITRAANAVEIWASEKVLRTTIEQKTQRVSGLLQRLTLE